MSSEQIKISIRNNKLDEAAEEIQNMLVAMEDFKNDIYHECLYLSGNINTKRFKQTGEKIFYTEAIKYFASANNAYLSIHNDTCDEYLEAIKYVEGLHRNKNIKRTN